MSTWANIVIPLLTLVLGSALTIAGQALRDRRQAERERRSLRAGFLAANFEVHRAAILEMQEIVSDFYEAYLNEKRRRIESGFYEFFDDFPRAAWAEQMKSSLIDFGELDQVLKDGTLDKDEKREKVAELSARIEAGTKAAKERAEEMGDSATHVETLYPFWEMFTDFSSKLRLRELRSGSNSVIETTEKFLNAIFKWNDQFSNEERLNELNDEVIECRLDLNQALSNALKYGPYNKLDENEKRSRS